jgi:hypothetical protein
MLAIFLFPSGMSLTKLSLGGNYQIISPRDSLLNDIPAGDRKMAKLFLQCTGGSNPLPAAKYRAKREHFSFCIFEQTIFDHAKKADTFARQKIFRKTVKLSVFHLRFLFSKTRKAIVVSILLQGFQRKG